MPASRTAEGEQLYVSLFTPKENDPYWEGHLRSYRFTGSGHRMKALNRLFLLLTVLGLLMAVIPLISSFALTMFLMFFTMFISAGFIIGSLAYANSHHANAHGGLIAGVGAGAWAAGALGSSIGRTVPSAPRCVTPLRIAG